MEKFKPAEFEAKWQKIWQEKGLHTINFTTNQRPFYNLMMFPYPSAEGLHVGSFYTFTGIDTYGRFKRMQGYEVFEPIGLDAFGIHSENYALKVNRHPRQQAKISQKNFYRQLFQTGNMFDWGRTVETNEPNYYKWTQWLFIKMFKAGLAYRAQAEVNWCPSCKTVLADEQVIDGRCERCSTQVEKKKLEQWFFRIATGKRPDGNSYPDSLLNNLTKIDWVDKVKLGQRNWIGRKEGIIIKYQIANIKYQIECFTTRPDTNFGATFVVIGPEHPFVATLLKLKVKSEKLKIDQIREYVEKAKKTSEEERIAAGRKKTGVFTGFYCINQLNNYKMPLYISDFVLGNVGTGAVVGVPGHDKRDFEFAQVFKLPVVRVVIGSDGDRSPITRIEQVQEEEGTMINSGLLNGKNIKDAIKLMMDHIEEKGWGRRVVTYHIRDWLISRQRYWGAPIPMIYCEKCDWVPVPEEDLPVLLPDIKDWRPTGTGRGPLAGVPEFYNVACPECRSPSARRETDVCDTFLDSSWYFLRYPFTEFKDIPFGSEKFLDMYKGQKNTSDGGRKDSSEVEESESEISFYDLSKEKQREVVDRMKKWLPVTSYIGGAEHTVLHLLYARWITMALYDLGFFHFEEPFTRFYAHGHIIREGAKMSKSKGNIVNPDEYIAKYGADTLRAYLRFIGPFDAGGDFRDTGIAGMHRFLSRVWRLVREYQISNIKYQKDEKTEGVKDTSGVGTGDLTRSMHKTIKEVTEDLENLRFNTAVAHIMEYVNEISNVKSSFDKTQDKQISNLPKEIIETLLLLLAPMVPHMAEELWSRIKYHVSGITYGKNKNIPNTKYVIRNTDFQSIHLHPWPTFDPKYLVEDEVTIVVQVNGKVRDTIKVRSEKSKVKSTIEEEAKKSEKVKKYIEGKTIRKTIFVPGKLINFVV